jgi:hypothetical protein
MPKEGATNCNEMTNVDRWKDRSESKNKSTVIGKMMNLYPE